MKNTIARYNLPAPSFGWYWLSPKEVRAQIRTYDLIRRRSLSFKLSPRIDNMEIKGTWQNTEAEQQTYETGH